MASKEAEINAGGKDTPGVITLPPVIYLVPLAAGILLNLRKPTPALPARLAVPLGWFLVGLATLNEGWFVLTMQRARTSINPYKPVKKLALNGPFRYSRNPSYLSFTLYYLGISLLVNTRWSLFLLPGTLFIVQKGVIEREEHYLEAKFGQEYLQYKAKVRRWL